MNRSEISQEEYLKEHQRLQDLIDARNRDALQAKARITVYPQPSGESLHTAYKKAASQQISGESPGKPINLLSLHNQIKQGNYEQVRNIAGRILEGTSEIRRLNRREERGRIAGGRIAVEASIVAGTNKRANYGKLEERSQKEQEFALEQYAKASGIYFSEEDISEMVDDGFTEFRPGAEARVWMKKDDNKRVIKVINYKTFSETPLEFLDNRIAIHNANYKETAYILEGFTTTKEGFSFVVSQNFIPGKNLETLAEESVSEEKGLIEALEEQYARVATYLYEKLGFDDLGGDSYVNIDYELDDQHMNNVIEGADGNLYFIDTVMFLNENTRTYNEFNIADIAQPDSRQKAVESEQQTVQI